MADEKIPKNDLEHLADILKSSDVPEYYPDVLLKNGFEFAGATASEATFIRNDGFRVILMPDKWRCVWPTGQSHDGNSFSQLREIVDTSLRKL